MRAIIVRNFGYVITLKVPARYKALDGRSECLLTSLLTFALAIFSLWNPQLINFQISYNLLFRASLRHYVGNHSLFNTNL